MESSASETNDELVDVNQHRLIRAAGDNVVAAESSEEESLTEDSPIPAVAVVLALVLLVMVNYIYSGGTNRNNNRSTIHPVIQDPEVVDSLDTSSDVDISPGPPYSSHLSPDWPPRGWGDGTELDSSHGSSASWIEDENEWIR
ncbi:uncharacterized protein [Branchiostoma lanceolatum]|uniref:uncharacterized protein n=1 Tax=Branchiostoma lanceolatum TaxID=7740 RepID=UPI0034572632